VKIDEGYQKNKNCPQLTIKFMGWGSCQSFLSLCWHHPSARAGKVFDSQTTEGGSKFNHWRTNKYNFLVVCRQPTIKFTGFLPINFLPQLAPTYSIGDVFQPTIKFTGFLPINFLPQLAPTYSIGDVFQKSYQGGPNMNGWPTTIGLESC